MPQYTDSQLTELVNNYIKNQTEEDSISPVILGDLLLNVVSSKVNKNATSQGAFKFYAEYDASSGLATVNETTEAIPSPVEQIEGRLYQVTVEGEQNLNGTGMQLYKEGDLIVCIAIEGGFMWRMMGNINGGEVDLTGTPYNTLVYDGSGAPVSSTYLPDADGNTSFDFHSRVAATPMGVSCVYYGDELHGFMLLGGADISLSPFLRQGYRSGNRLSIDYEIGSLFGDNGQIIFWGDGSTPFQIYDPGGGEAVVLQINDGNLYLPNISETGRLLYLNEFQQVITYNINTVVLSNWEDEDEVITVDSNDFTVNLPDAPYIDIALRGAPGQIASTIHINQANDSNKLYSRTLWLTLMNGVAGEEMAFYFDTNFYGDTGGQVIGNSGDTELKAKVLQFKFVKGKYKLISMTGAGVGFEVPADS